MIQQAVGRISAASSAIFAPGMAEGGFAFSALRV
jgi:hypothetical protein